MADNLSGQSDVIASSRFLLEELKAELATANELLSNALEDARGRISKIRKSDLSNKTQTERAALLKEMQLIDLSYQPEIRIWVRIHFAFLEASCFVFKHYALTICDCLNIKVPKEERALALEQRIDNSGKAVRFSIRARENYKATLRLLQRASRSIPSEIENDKWEKFLKAIEVRNRITHPKALKDILITRNEYHEISEGLRWFLNRLLEALSALPADNAR